MKQETFFKLTIFLALCSFLSGCHRTEKSTRASTIARVPVCNYRVIETYPHDSKAFTQGLIFDRGYLYESTGLHGESSLRKVDLETGEVLQVSELDDRYFGEGMTVWQDRLIQITWVSKTGFVYDKETFEQIDTFTYPTQGWGLTHDNNELILSDGTATLYFLDPDTYEITREIPVTDNGRAVDKLNELEYVRGEIWANVWLSDRIARINPITGVVTGWLDLEGIIQPQPTPTRDAVLNGIAYDAESDRLLVTGKLWSKLFEIEPVCE
ncbi:MAG: glutaminyl-peptide cyclotransferase [Cyanobacteria bacterium J06623_7]